MKALSPLLVCALAGVAALAAPVAAATTEGRLVTRDHGTPIDLPLAHTDVHLRVEGFLVDATVTQRFTNPYATKIEAVYLFPLPTRAAVTEMTIRVGARTIRGTIRERGEATRVYRAARDRGLVAALLTEERPNLFTQSVANLEPHATIEVTLRYVERLAYEDGGYEVVFPMVAGPRYGGDPRVTAPSLPPGTRSSHDIGLDATIDAGVPIADVGSPSHRVVIARPSPSRAEVHLAPGDTVPNKDFVLRYRVAGRAPAFGALAYKDGDTGSFLLIAQPPAEAAAVPVTPREIIFVLDTSSSMRGAPLAKAKALIRGVLTTLRPDDTFQIVRFDDRASALGPGPIANHPRNIQLVLDWLAKLDAAGGTEMTTGIDAALAVPHDPARLRIIAFLTDGYVGNEDAILAEVAAHAGEARLFSFGVGSAVNRYLLEEMAVQGRGAAQFVRPDEDTAAAVAAFERRIDAPVLTDVHVDWGGLAVTDVSPRAVPDLFLGQPLVLAGHYTRGGTGTVVVHGRQGGREVRFAVPVALPDHDAARPAIATVWARERIAELSRQLVRKDDPARVAEITRLSLAYHLLTPYTAFVAVDDARVTAGGKATRVVVPVEVPAAVAGIQPAGFGGAYGTGGGYGVGDGAASVGYGAASVGYGMVGTGSFGRVEVGGRAAFKPKLVVGTAQLTGTLDKQIIRRYIRRNVAEIRHCYEQALISHPTLAGSVIATFSLDADGRVLAANATGMDPDVDACITDVVRAIEFPKVPGGGVTQVTYPFTFAVAP